MTALKKKLKARTPMSDDINAQEKSLAARVGDRQKNEGAKEAEQQKQQLDAEEEKIIEAMQTEDFRIAVKKFTSKGK